MLKIPKSVFFVAAASVLTACGAKLIWEVKYETIEPKVVRVVAIDNHNNSYVGGGIQQFRSESTYYFNGLLLKYDVDGALLWSIEVPSASSILAVQPLNEELLAVVTGPMQADEQLTKVGAANATVYRNISDEDKTSELWLVSATTGQFLTRLKTFAGTFVDLEYQNDNLVIASQEGSQGEVARYDTAGNLLAIKSLSDVEPTDLGITTSGDVYVALEKQNSVIKLSPDLHEEWTLSPNSMLSFIDCAPTKIFAKDSVAYAYCAGTLQVKKISTSGEVISSTSLNSLIKETQDSGGKPYSMDRLFAPTEENAYIDERGDLYLALIRATIYGVADDQVLVGGSHVWNSILESDVVTLKINGNQGSIAWMDDVNTAIFGTKEGYNAYYYYPLSLDMHDEKMLLTFRGLGNNYTGDFGCGDVEPGFPNYFYFNMCVFRESTLDSYAKTITYSGTGKRIQEARHEISLPRAAHLDSDGNLIVAGDQASDLPFSFIEWISNKNDANTPDRSDIVIQKHKL